MISFYEKIRDEQRFSSVDDLIHQIAEDKERVERIFDKNFHLQENISMVI